ncbi:hypothetical protein CVT24_010486 [Panaeolus cyanescens]|uniref:CCHC-type domain-containing protein n=1 Tax=Panaeolus cyanescens TaxID=181874 RepID=A0A409YLX7_9AGAR|nr:hypothetical protein CVT24_010486 [Panaeolus cyanescens]
MTAKGRFPSPRDNNAPRFDKDEPTELVRFITEMEELFKEHNVTDAKDKMKKIVRYTDQRTEDQWKGFPSFDGTSWEKFKKELINSYPDAKETEKGSMRALEAISKRWEDLTSHNSDEIHELIRVFRGEVKKLEARKAVGKGVTSERELVSLFFRALSADFAERIKVSIDNEASMAYHADCALAKKNRDDLPEEPDFSSETHYTIKAVIRHATSLTDRSPVTSTLERRKGVKFEEKGIKSIKSEASDDLKMYIAQLRDIQQQNEKRIRDNEQRIKEAEQRNTALIERFMQEQRAQNQQGVPGNGYAAFRSQNTSNTHQNGAIGNFNGNNFGNSNFNRNPRPPRTFNDQGPGSCFYCKELGHAFAGCPTRLTHLDLGKVILDKSGMTRLPDGTTIPRFPEDKTMKDKVEDWHRNKEASANYQGWAREIGLAPSESPQITILTHKKTEDQDNFMNTRTNQYPNHKNEAGFD